jgi:hypothetical protein
VDDASTASGAALKQRTTEGNRITRPDHQYEPLDRPEGAPSEPTM